MAAGVLAEVRTTDGWPVAGAVLTVTDMAGQQVTRQPADADGQLATDPLPAGTYTAVITAAGFAPVARTAVITPSGAASLGVVPLARAGGAAALPAEGTWTIDPAHSAVTVAARHLGFASVRGRFTEFGGTIRVARPAERSTVTAVIEAASIDTGNQLRDEHLRGLDFLGVDQHPKIEYRGTSVTPAGGERWRLDGELSLNGVTRPVALDLTFLGAAEDPWGGTRIAFHAVTDLRRDDFAISYNQVVRAGIAAVGATLRVEIDVEAVWGDELPTG